jgi:hypothetical protein
MNSKYIEYKKVSNNTKEISLYYYYKKIDLINKSKDENKYKLWDLDIYQKLDKYKNSKKELKIIVHNHNYKTNNENIGLEYKKIIYFLHIDLYKKLKKKFKMMNKYSDEYFNKLLWLLYHIYSSLGLYNNSNGAIHPDTYKKLEKIGCRVECFGSFFNHTLENYCSLFYELNYKFGSIGNFFEVEFKKGIYVANPPFEVEFVNKMFEYINRQIEKSKEELVFIIILPAWDIEHRKLLNKYCREKISCIKYNENFNYNLLKKEFIQKNYLYCRNNFKYFSYINYKTVYFTATNVLCISKNKCKINFISIFGKPNIILKE